MISNDSNLTSSWGGWLRWLVNTAIALIAAGSGIVAMLDYFNLSIFAPASTSTAAMVALTNTPSELPSTQTSPPPTPTAIYNTATPLIPSPTDFVLSYWQNLSDGRYENAWAQLSPGFRRDSHNDDYYDYIGGYQQMNLCSIVVSNVNLIRQDSYSAVVSAHLTYHAGSQCNSSEYNFEMWLVYDGASNLWLFDKNVIK